jgi:hypothetical protein
MNNFNRRIGHLWLQMPAGMSDSEGPTLSSRGFGVLPPRAVLALSPFTLCSLSSLSHPSLYLSLQQQADCAPPPPTTSSTTGSHASSLTSTTSTRSLLEFVQVPEAKEQVVANPYRHGCSRTPQTQICCRDVESLRLSMLLRPPASSLSSCPCPNTLSISSDLASTRSSS